MLGCPKGFPDTYQLWKHDTFRKHTGSAWVASDRTPSLKLKSKEKMKKKIRRDFFESDENNVLAALTDSCLTREIHDSSISKRPRSVLPERIKRQQTKPNGSHHLFPRRARWTSDEGKSLHQATDFEKRKPTKFRQLLPPQPNSPQMLFRARKKLNAPSTPKTPGQVMSRIFQAGFDQMESSGPKKSTPQSSPFKASTLSPNYTLFNSPESHSQSKVSRFEKTDPFKSPLPVKKCVKRRYNADSGSSTPLFSPHEVRRRYNSSNGNNTPSSSQVSYNRSRSGTAASSPYGRWSPRNTITNNMLRKPFGTNKYSAKRKLSKGGLVHGSNRVKRFRGNPATYRASPSSSSGCPFQRRKGKLLFTSTPKQRSPRVQQEAEDSSQEKDESLSEIPILLTPQQRNADTSKEESLSPEIPIQSTPMQRRQASQQLAEQNVFLPDTKLNRKAVGESYAKSSDKTVLQFNKPERSYLDCDSQSDDESVIEDCHSPEVTSERVGGNDELRVKLLTESLRGTTIERKTESGVSLIDEALDCLSQSQKKYHLEDSSQDCESNHEVLHSGARNTSERNDEARFPTRNHEASTNRYFGSSLGAAPREKKRFLEKDFLSPVAGDSPPSCEDSLPSRPVKRKTAAENKRSNVRIALPFGTSEQPSSMSRGRCGNVKSQLSYVPSSSPSDIEIRRKKKLKAISKKQLLRTIASTKYEMSSIRDEYENEEETQTDRRWKSLLSDSAHVVDGVTAKLRDTASSAPDVELQPEFEIGVGDSIADEIVGFHEAYKKF